jgi:ribosome-binding factor A
LVGGDDDKTRKNALAALDRARNMLKRELASRVKTRIVPNLRFFYDEGQDRQTRVEALLHEIATERKR